MQSVKTAKICFRRADRLAREFAVCCTALLSIATLIGQGFVPRCAAVSIAFSSAYPQPPCQDYSAAVCVAGVSLALLLWLPIYRIAFSVFMRRRG